MALDFRQTQTKCPLFLVCLGWPHGRSPSSHIAQLEAELAERMACVAEDLARISGIKAELEAWRAQIAGTGGLVEMSRTGALLAVLRQAAGTMSPTELVQALRAAGRSDELRSVTATLDYLLKSGSVERPSRGRYLAT